MTREKKNLTLPRYQEIAVEIAERIVENRYQVGEKIYARSTLASNFNVSAETARKAINVLVDLEIMEVQQGSGTYVASRDKAKQFVDKYQNVQTLNEIKRDVLTSIKRQKEELDNTTQLMEMLLKQSKQIQDVSPFIPYQLKITSKALHIEKSIAELNIWQKTGATIVAIQTDSALLLSPGPYAKLSIGNTIYFVGDDLVVQRMNQFFYPKTTI
ncbi:MAG TPA: GntR family transcriptional regulator [Candidatus Tetragenococcus pullicola]|nr:GntR family transcriptional regulator [Candidatus Tetragenococcus pullicola]